MIHPLILSAQQLAAQADSVLPLYDLGFILQVVSQSGLKGRAAVVAHYQSIRDAARNPAAFQAMKKQIELLIHQFRQESDSLKQKIDESPLSVMRAIGKFPWTAFARGKAGILAAVCVGLNLAAWRTNAGLLYNGGIASSEFDAAAMSMIAVGSSFTLKPIEESLPSDQKKRRFRFAVGVTSVVMVVGWTGLMSTQWGHLWVSQNAGDLVSNLFAGDVNAATSNTFFLTAALLCATILTEFSTSGSIFMLLESTFRQHTEYAASTSPECKFLVDQRDEVERNLAAAIDVHCQLERRCEELRHKDSTYPEGEGLVCDAMYHEQQAHIARELKQHYLAKSQELNSKATLPRSKDQAPSNGQDH